LGTGEIRRSVSGFCRSERETGGEQIRARPRSGSYFATTSCLAAAVLAAAPDFGLLGTFDAAEAAFALVTSPDFPLLTKITGLSNDPHNPRAWISGGQFQAGIVAFPEPRS
jgi:hypothetical protein